MKQFIIEAKDYTLTFDNENVPLGTPQHGRRGRASSG